VQGTIDSRTKIWIRCSVLQCVLCHGCNAVQSLPGVLGADCSQVTVKLGCGKLHRRSCWRINTVCVGLFCERDSNFEGNLLAIANPENDVLSPFFLSSWSNLV